MYERFLNNKDYLALLTEEDLEQLVRDNLDHIPQAEEMSEMSMVEYLSQNYEIEKELEIGKSIKEYSRAITYPPGVFFYYDGKIMETIKVVNGFSAPTIEPYWEEIVDPIPQGEEIDNYTQLGSYSPNDKVVFSGVPYLCLKYNGQDYADIRIPGYYGWAMLQNVYDWLPNLPYKLWSVVSYHDNYYALIDCENVDATIDPFTSPNWGMIADYDPTYNAYEETATEFVVYEGRVFAPITNVNASELKLNDTVKLNDPRNLSVKKHMLRMTVYELYKLVSPYNISQPRIMDYEQSIQWLSAAARMKITPNIPRKVDEYEEPIRDYAVASFQRRYDAANDPWII